MENLKIIYENSDYKICNSIIDDENIEKIKNFIKNAEKIHISFIKSYIDENNMLKLIKELFNLSIVGIITIKIDNDSINLINDNNLNKNYSYEYCYNILNCKYISGSIVYYKCYSYKKNSFKIDMVFEYFDKNINDISTLTFRSYDGKKNFNSDCVYTHRQLYQNKCLDIPKTFLQFILNIKNQNKKLHIKFNKCYLNLTFNNVKKLLQNNNISIIECLMENNYRIFQIKELENN